MELVDDSGWAAGEHVWCACDRLQGVALCHMLREGAVQKSYLDSLDRIVGGRGDEHDRGGDLRIALRRGGRAAAPERDGRSG